MSDFDAHMKDNPKAQRDEAALREAFRLLEELQSAGIEADGYTLAPAFGGNVIVGDTRPSLSSLSNHASFHKR